MPQRELNATVVSRRDLNRNLSIVRIRPDSSAVPEFEPGQFIRVGLLPQDDPGEVAEQRRPRLVRRAYSIASPPACRDYVELFLALIEFGRFTPRLWTVREGGRVWLDDRVAGDFTLEAVPPGRDLIMVASGTGVAPFVSMLRTYRRTGRWRRFVLINGVRFAADLGFREELERIAAEDPDVIYLPTATREPADSGWTGLRGRVQAILTDESFHRLAGAPLDPNSSHVFLCGNPAMIMETEALLEARGFRRHSRAVPGNLHYERYW